MSQKQNLTVTPQEATFLQIFRGLNLNDDEFAPVLDEDVVSDIIRLIRSYLEHYQKGSFVTWDFHDSPSGEKIGNLADTDRSTLECLTFGNDDSVDSNDSGVTWNDISFEGDWEDLLPNVELLTLVEVADLLEVSRERVESLVSEGRLLMLGTNSQRGERFPAEQFLEGSALSGLSKIITAIEQPELTWRFLSTPMFLESETARPIDVLKNGSEEDINAIVKTAQRYPVEFS